MLELFERGQAIDIRLIGINLRACGLELRLGGRIARLLVFALLFGDDALGRVTPTRIGAGRKRRIGLFDLDLSLRDLQFRLGGE